MFVLMVGPVYVDHDLGCWANIKRVAGYLFLWVVVAVVVILVTYLA